MIRRAAVASLAFLLIEGADELAFGASAAALPAIRTQLGMGYLHIGLLLGLPPAIAAFIEPAVMLWGDTRARRSLIIAGGSVMTLCLLAIALATDFLSLLVPSILIFPASGAFVSLSQACLMDRHRGSETQAMARWSLAGSVGAVGGPMVFGAAILAGFGWRPMFALLAMLTAALTVSVVAIRNPREVPQGGQSLRQLASGAWALAGDRRMTRWLLLLQMSDLMLDVLAAYMAMYLADVVRLAGPQLALALAAFTTFGLLGDAISLPLLDRIPGRRLVQISSVISAGIYAAMLLLHAPLLKLAALLLLGATRLGWYPVLQGEAFAVAPRRAGSVLALTSLSGLLAAGLAGVVGWFAAHAGLTAAMWLLLAGPACLLAFMPRPARGVQ
jgi:MFS transporter, FSR family, fosmidomycin resistance protein